MELGEHTFFQFAPAAPTNREYLLLPRDRAQCHRESKTTANPLESKVSGEWRAATITGWPNVFGSVRHQASHTPACRILSFSAEDESLWSNTRRNTRNR